MVPLSLAPTESDLHSWRRDLGAGFVSWTNGPEMFGTVTDGYWAGLTAIPAADMNIAVVDGNAPEHLAAAIEDIERVGAPATLVLAGAGLAHADALPARWTRVGEMPIMSADLSSLATGPDPRVRPATLRDAPAVAQILTGAFGLASSVTQATVDCILSARAGTTTWVLEDSGVVVSVVVSTRSGDSVGLWCMGTPPTYARRGYARALLSAVLDWAKNDGAVRGLLGATPAGYPLYAATGWQTVERWWIASSA